MVVIKAGHPNRNKEHRLTFGEMYLKTGALLQNVIFFIHCMLPVFFLCDRIYLWFSRLTKLANTAKEKTVLFYILIKKGVIGIVETAPNYLKDNKTRPRGIVASN